MESSSNVYRFNGVDPYDNWCLKSGVLYGYYPRNSIINILSNKGGGIGVYSNYCVIRDNVKVISRNCFRNNKKFLNIFLSEGLETIEEHAFKNIKAKEIGIPKSVKHIRKNSFDGDITLYVYPGTYGEKYVIRWGYKYRYYEE